MLAPIATKTTWDGGIQNRFGRLSTFAGLGQEVGKAVDGQKGSRTERVSSVYDMAWACRLPPQTFSQRK